MEELIIEINEKLKIVNKLLITTQKMKLPLEAIEYISVLENRFKNISLTYKDLTNAYHEETQMEILIDLESRLFRIIEKYK